MGRELKCKDVTCRRSGVSVTDFNVMIAAEYLDVCLILGSE